MASVSDFCAIFLDFKFFLAHLVQRMPAIINSKLDLGAEFLRLGKFGQGLFGQNHKHHLCVNMHITTLLNFSS